MCFGQMQNRERLLEECVAYLRARPVLDRVLRQLWEKAVSLGHIGGKVSVSIRSESEREQLEGFFGKNFHGKKQAAVSVVLMERALADSRFAEFSWDEILTVYFGTPLIGKKEQKEQAEKDRNTFFAQYANSEGTAGARFLAEMLSGACEGRSLLYTQYRTDRELLGQRIRMLIRACDNLPAERGLVQALPVFAAEISGDPHYFDEGTTVVRFLRLFIQERYGMKRQPSYSDTEWKARILYRAGILKDDLSNTVLIYGLQAFLQDGTRHIGLDGFYQIREPLQCTLQTLYRLDRISGGEDVYVVENPAVFAALVSRYPEKAFVCTNGQLRLSALILLDLLSRESRLHYAGDYDPEGLGIAQRLKNRYGSRLELWEYKPEYYLRAGAAENLREGAVLPEGTVSSESGISLEEAVSPESTISSERMKKLDKLKAAELVKIADLIRQYGRAVYQETMLAWAYQLSAL